jgi:hypothetical protein
MSTLAPLFGNHICLDLLLSDFLLKLSRKESIIVHLVPICDNLAFLSNVNSFSLFFSLFIFFCCHKTLIFFQIPFLFIYIAFSL